MFAFRGVVAGRSSRVGSATHERGTRFAAAFTALFLSTLPGTTHDTTRDYRTRLIPLQSPSQTPIPNSAHSLTSRASVACAHTHSALLVPLAPPDPFLFFFK